MGCASSTDASTAPVSGTHHTTPTKAAFAGVATGRHPPTRATTAAFNAMPAASVTVDSENPLVGPAHPQRQFHPDPMLEDAANSTEQSTDTASHLRKHPRHRSISVVAGTYRGRKAPEPPTEEHLAHIDRLAAIAPIHGITADVNQFRPDPVSAAELVRCREVCREWLQTILLD